MKTSAENKVLAMVKHRVSILIFSLLVLTSSVSVADPSGSPVVPSQERIVERYMAAFNAHDAQAMSDMVTEDVQWLSIDGEKITKETNSKEELVSGMLAYFESCKSCQSRLGKISSMGTRVTALEIASYQTRKGVKEQQSLSVYEFSGSLIRRVYYFPVD